MGFFELEHDRVSIRRLDGSDVARQHGAEAHGRIFDLGRHGCDDVISGELDAIAPEDAAAQLDRHFGEVGVVLRLVGSQRIVPDTIETALGIDIPERIKRGLLQPIGLRAGVDHPDVEPAGVFDGAFRVLEDQKVLPRNVLRNSLRKTRFH